MPMPHDVESKCFNLKACITSSSRFSKICLDPDVLELRIWNTSDIRNDCEDNNTRVFRKAAYRQFILARYGYLGTGKLASLPLMFGPEDKTALPICEKSLHGIQTVN